METSETYPMQLPVPLEKGDSERLLSELLSLMATEEGIEVRKKAALAGFRQESAEVTAKLSEVRKSLTEGTKMREVPVREYAFPDRGVTEIHRTDVPKSHPNRIVETRPMNLFDQTADDDQIAADEEAAMADAAAASDADEPAKRKRGRPRANGPDKTAKRSRKAATAGH